jgi:methylated-DNA-[protein]-cysteine S-methyltransferase
VSPRFYTTVDSPIGQLVLVADDAGVREIRLPGVGTDVPAGWQRSDTALTAVRDQIRAYFAGDLSRFDLRLAPEGTPFQTRVWNALLEIPYGETCSYRDIAHAIGRPTATRAVGAANGQNPIAIVIPCHRVIGSDGSLTGYGGGLHVKAQLLALERSRTRPDAPGGRKCVI